MTPYSALAAGQRTCAPQLPRDQHARLRTALSIKNRYADGQPLAGRDLRFIAGLLNQHPRAGAKVGCGIAAIVAHGYVGGSRCFFVIRTDGTAEDFSVYKCLGQRPERSDRVRAMMRAFPYQRVTRAFRTAWETARTA